MRRAILVAVAVAVLCSGLAHAESTSITKIEARSLPPGVVLHRVLDQFADVIILPEQIKPSVRPKHPLTDMYYATRPRGTYFHDLCQADQVKFDFDPVGKADDNADAPMKVSGISVRNTFRFLAAPSGSSSTQTMSSAERKELKERCAKLDPEAGFFDADSDEVAEEGGLLLQAVLRDTANGATPPSYECDGYTPKECADIVKQAALDKLMFVKRCANYTGDERCTEIWAQFVGLTVLSTGYGDTLKVVRVKVSEVVTTGDERED